MLTRTGGMKGEFWIVNWRVPSSYLTILIWQDCGVCLQGDMERAMDKFDDYELNGRRIKVGT